MSKGHRATSTVVTPAYRTPGLLRQAVVEAVRKRQAARAARAK